MNKVSLKEIFSLSEKLSRYCENNKPVTYRPAIGQIRYAEKVLNFRLPPSYIQFWQEIKVCHWCLAGICKMVTADDNLSQHFPDIIAENMKIRKIVNNGTAIPPFLTVFDVAAAIDDDYCCFDTRYGSAEGEYPVVYWSTEEPDYLVSYDKTDGSELIIDDIIRAASDFPTYLYNCLEDEIKIREQQLKRKKQTKQNQIKHRHSRQNMR